MNRLEFLKRLGYTVAGATLLGVDAKAILPSDVAVMPKPGEDYDIFHSGALDLSPNVPKPITVTIIGAGGRGNAYASYAEQFPEGMKVIGVSDIKENRRTTMAKRYNIKKEHQFGDYSEVFKIPKFADAVVISTPDDTHFEPCMMALEKGYDVLLEKPIAPTEEECRKILAQAKKYNRIVAVCHVLRYAPYFIALKKAISEGMVGDVISIQHTEPILFDHMAHSYVRGNWHNSKQSTPIILAKSCHDLDILRWLIDKPCKTISADGGLSFFKASNAPAGSTLRCMDGCLIESQCPYSALNIYVRRHRMLKVFDLPQVDNELIKEKLRTTNYGKCVFKCDNDQCDHLVVNMVFDGGITAGFNMEAFTSYSGRRTRVMGTKGDIVGDMNEFVVTDFLTHRKTVWNEKVKELDAYKNAGHGGGDWGLTRDFVRAVAFQDKALLSSTIDASIESHVMGFKAEESRLSMQKMLI